MTPPTSAPRVSVLMTVYNAAIFLKDAVDSIVGQDFRDWELIAVENGSTDNSLAILEDYRDHRIRIVALPANIGRTPALNLGLRNARGTFVAVLDADDIALPERLAAQVAFLESHPEIVLVGSRNEHFRADGFRREGLILPTEHDDIIDAMADGTPISHPTVMFRLEKAIAVGGYPADFPFAQDFAFYIMLAANRGRLANLDRKLVRVRLHPEQASAASSWAVRRTGDAVACFEMVRRLLPMSVPARRRNRKCLATCRMQHALALWRARRYLGALAVGVGGLTTDPVQALAIVRRRLTARTPGSA